MKRALPLCVLLVASVAHADESPQRRYGDTRDVELTAANLREAASMDALPWVIAYLDDPRAPLRDAARQATEKFGTKATDLLRVRLSELTGEPPDFEASAEALFAQLVAHEEHVRTRPAREALAQAERLLARKVELDRATQLLDQALGVGVPDADATRLARAYLALGAQRDQQDQRAPALVAFRRALRADPTGPHAKQAESRVLYLEAEARLAEGIVDAHSLRRAVALDARQPAAKQLLERLESARENNASKLRTWLGYAAASLLLIAAFLTLCMRKRVGA